mgnify:CR=1 FL=1
MKHDHPTESPDPLADYAPVTLRARHDGWTAQRQRAFLRALADTGCISEAANAAGITPRSAYRLRNHPDGEVFAMVWDRALQFATARLMTTAYERALKGGVREMWRDGALVATVRQPSDRVLMWLLDRIAPRPGSLNGPAFGWRSALNWGNRIRGVFDAALEALVDSDVPADPLPERDDRPLPLADRHEPLSPPCDEGDDYDYAKDDR